MTHAAVLLVSLFFQVDAVRFERWDPKMLALLDRAPYYLDRTTVLALAEAVPAPPENASPTTRRELDELLALERKRTTAQNRSITAHLDFRGLCAAVIGSVHRELTNAPKTRALLQHVERDATLAVFQAKKKWMRARPHQLEPSLHPAIGVPGHPAYPSGHAIFGQIVARTLAEIFPDYRQGLLEAGTEIGSEREIAGVHYASDSAAGRALADAIFAKLVENPKFRRELSLAMGEWTCAGP